MRNAFLSAIAMGCLTLGLFIAALAGPGATAAELSPLTQGFGAGLATDRPAYWPGQPILITFEVFNRTRAPVIFDFTGGQRYDVVIEEDGGNEVWRWSAGKMFATAMGREILGPGNPRLIYETEYNARLEPGRYRIIGVLTDVRRQISATISLDVQ